MFRFTTSRFIPKPLAALISVVSEKKVQLKPDDIFKLCVTANGRDGKQLDLLSNKEFVSSLRDAAVENLSAFSPFQLNQVKEMCTKAGLDFESSSTSSSSSSSFKSASTTVNVASTTATVTASSSSSQTVGQKLWDTSTVVPESTKTDTEQGASESKSETSSHLAEFIDGSTNTQQQQQQPYQIDAQTDPRALQDIMDALFVAKRTFDERNTYELKKVQDVTNSSNSEDRSVLINLLPWLSAKPLLYIIKVLAHINHQDYTLAQKLSRRICELASTLTTTQCTKVLGQLYRLKVHDSMTVLVRKIENETKPLHMAELMNIIAAAHAQTQVSAALQPLVGRSLYEVSGRVGEKHMHIVQLVQCVEVAAKFGQASNPHVKLIVMGAARRASEMSDRLLASTVQNAHAMNLIASANVSEVFQPLHDRAVALVPSDDGMDVRYLEPLLDVFSLLPFNSAPFMDAVLVRLSDDAGKLHPGNLVSVIELIASYPGAKGSTAIPALALAATVRKEVLDQQSLIIVVLSLAQLNQLNEEFFELLEFLCGDERKGFKQGSEVVELLSYLDYLPNDRRFVPLIVRASSDVIPSMGLQDTLDMQKELVRLQMEDRGLNRRLVSRLESLNVERAEAERAANMASLRRMSNQNHSQHQHHNHNSHQAEMEWEAVGAPSRQQQQPQQQQQNFQRSQQIDYSGWGDAEVRMPPSPSQQQPRQHQHQQNQHHQQQFHQQQPNHYHQQHQHHHHQQQFHQQQHHQQQQHHHQQQNPGRKLSSREMAALSKQRAQQQQRQNPNQQKQKKKPFDLKKAQWDMDI